MAKRKAAHKKPKTSKKSKSAKIPTLKLVTESEIAMDFAQKVAEKFDKMVKSVILFGSTVKGTRSDGSDIDIIIIVDDSSIKFDQELVAWYREELGKLIAANPYKKEIHINTVKLTTWWADLMKGDPVVMNIIRYGEPLVDFGGFYKPIRMLLEAGKIKPTPEAIYSALQRAPLHLAASKQAELGAVEGIYWAMVDSANALLIARDVMPASPEQIDDLLIRHFVNRKLLNKKYVMWYKDVYALHKSIVRGDISDVKGENIDVMQDQADEFIRKMAELIDSMI